MRNYTIYLSPFGDVGKEVLTVKFLSHKARSDVESSPRLANLSVLLSPFFNTFPVFYQFCIILWFLKQLSFCWKPPLGTSLLTQLLRLDVPNAGGPGSILCQWTRSLMPQVRVCMPQLIMCHNKGWKSPTAKTSTWCRQINLKKKKRYY